MSKILNVLTIFTILIFVNGCNLLYFIPPKESMLRFSIGEFKDVWKSQGFEAFEGRDIKFYSKKKFTDFRANYLFISLKEPVAKKKFTEKNARISFHSSRIDLQQIPVLDSKDPRTKIRINLKKWSDKPRGLIEGDIEATLYDKNGKEYKMSGHFKAYQALGTINSFH